MERDVIGVEKDAAGVGQEAIGVSLSGLGLELWVGGVRVCGCGIGRFSGRVVYPPLYSLGTMIH